MASLLGLLVFIALGIFAIACFQASLGPILRHLRPRITPTLKIIRADIAAQTTRNSKVRYARS